MEMAAEQAVWDLATQQLKTGTSFVFAARGQSMRPSIPDGSQVTLIPLNNPVRPGDVVLARREEQVVLHRVLAYREGNWILKGDLNDATQRFRPEEIIGRVLSVRHGDRVQRYDTPFGRLRALFWLQISRRTPLWRRFRRLF